MKDTKLRLLVVDDDVEHAALLGYLLAEHNFQTTLAYDGAEALQKIQTNYFDFIVSDIRMPGMSGIELMQMCKTVISEPPKFLFVTGYTDYPEDEILKLGGLKVFKKPVEPEEIADFLNQIV